MKYLLIAVLALSAFGCKKAEEAPAADASVEVEGAVDAAQEATATAAIDATATTAVDVTAIAD